MGEDMNIELLYFNGCPSWEEGLKNFKDALSAEGVFADVSLLLIEDNSEAIKEKFLGSPSFRIDGQDLWPDERQSYYLGCRLYITQEGMRGVPTVTMLREKIRNLIK